MSSPPKDSANSNSPPNSPKSKDALAPELKGGRPPAGMYTLLMYSLEFQIHYHLSMTLY